MSEWFVNSGTLYVRDGNRIRETASVSVLTISFLTPLTATLTRLEPEVSPNHLSCPAHPLAFGLVFGERRSEQIPPDC